MTKYSDGTRKESTWVAGKQTGPFTQTDPDGSKYEGNYVDGKEEGVGVTTYPDGTRLESTWAADKKSKCTGPCERNVERKGRFRTGPEARCSCTTAPYRKGSLGNWNWDYCPEERCMSPEEKRQRKIGLTKLWTWIKDHKKKIAGIVVLMGYILTMATLCYIQHNPGRERWYGQEEDENIMMCMQRKVGEQVAYLRNMGSTVADQVIELWDNFNFKEFWESFGGRFWDSVSEIKYILNYEMRPEQYPLPGMSDDMYSGPEEHRMQTETAQAAHEAASQIRTFVGEMRSIEYQPGS